MVYNLLKTIGDNNMETSIFFAKFIGFYLVIVLVSLLINYSRYKDILIKIATPNVTVLFGMLSLLFGLVVVLLHNIWVWDWRVLITLVGWFSILRGVTRLFFPDWVIKMIVKFAENKIYLVVMSVVFILIGLFLLFHGYFG